MKGLQGERLRQAFKYLDKDQDGYIRPEQFKKIILVRPSVVVTFTTPLHVLCIGHCWPQTVRCRHRATPDSDYPEPRRPHILLRSQCIPQRHQRYV